jgi:DHA2 family multidrug resistance protein
MSPATASGLYGLNAEITRQAAMVGYVDIYRLMMVMAVAIIPLLLLIRRPKNVGVTAEIVD